MPAYLDLAGFRAETELPGADVDDVEAEHSGWIDRQLTVWSGWIDTRLRKRYPVPFTEPYPLAIQSWLARIITPKVLRKRGVDSTDRQYVDILDDAKAAMDEVREAAESEESLFDLPPTAGASKSGVSRGGPFGYSEASPYVWMDGQAQDGRAEDAAGGGTHG